MQVYATIFHVGLRRVKAQLRKLTLTPPLQRGEEAGYMIIIQMRAIDPFRTSIFFPKPTLGLRRRHRLGQSCRKLVLRANFNWKL